MATGREGAGVTRGSGTGTSWKGGIEQEQQAQQLSLTREEWALATSRYFERTCRLASPHGPYGCGRSTCHPRQRNNSGSWPSWLQVRGGEFICRVHAVHPAPRGPVKPAPAHPHRNPSNVEKTRRTLSPTTSEPRLITSGASPLARSWLAKLAGRSARDNLAVAPRRPPDQIRHWHRGSNLGVCAWRRQNSREDVPTSRISSCAASKTEQNTQRRRGPPAPISRRSSTTRTRTSGTEHALIKCRLVRD